MDKNHIIDLIVKDADEVYQLTNNFKNYASIPPIYMDLTLSKVKNLYAELLLLQDGNISGKRLSDLTQELQSKRYEGKEETSQPQEPAPAKKEPASFPKKPVDDEFTSLNRKREEHFLATQLKFDRIADIKKAISLNEKIWFIKELFEGDIDTYNQTLEKLNTYGYLEEALDYLDDTFDWEYENQTVRDFMEFVYRKFI